VRIRPALLAAALALVPACSSGRPASSPATAATTVPVTAGPVPTAPAPVPVATTVPPTTAYSPPDPASTPDGAAGDLVDDWSSGDRAAAAKVAGPAAVATLFAIPYPAGYLQDRGCTAASSNPGTCTYRNTETDGIYEIGVTQVSSGWYVSSVTSES
jgi:hypothetical protein